MKFTRTKGLMLVGLIAVLWGGYWIYENFELKEIRYPSSLRGEAVRNNLLAAERFAASLGAQSASGFGFRRLPEGPPGRAVLVLPTLRRTLTVRQRDELMRWIDAGGHLVAVAYTLESEGDKPDPLMTAIGVRQVLSDEGKKYSVPRKGEEEDDDLDDDRRIKREREARVQRERRALERNRIMRNLLEAGTTCPQVRETGSNAPLFPATGTTMLVCFDAWFRLESKDPPLWAVSDGNGVHAITMPRGKGKITILTDYDFMQNDRIAKADHSVFLAALLGFTGAGDTNSKAVFFIPREDVTGIVQLTWQYAWPAVLALVAWLLLGLWRAGARFGPLIPARSTVRRSLAEHVRASGEFLWRHGENLHLWRATLARTKRHIERVLPAAAFSGTGRHLEAMAVRSGIDAKHIERALDSRYTPSAEQFPTIIATLELLRKKL
ncbi:MAG: DUF4350 domain-containing protein [Betaproteobacteria bacterium]